MTELAGGHLLGRAARIGRVRREATACATGASGEPDARARAPLARRARGARPDLRQARPDPLHAARPAPARVRRGARDACRTSVPPLTEAEVVAGDGAGARRPVGGRLRVASSPSRSRPGRSARCTARRSRAASASSSRCSGPTRARRDPARPRPARAASPRRRERREALPAARRHPGRRRAPLLLAAPRARLPPGGGEHRAHARGARAVRRGSTCPRVHDAALDRAAARDGGDRQGVPIRDAPPGDERREAARQLLEAFYRQVLHGRASSTPTRTPATCSGANDKIYLLDLGMVGELEAGAARAAAAPAPRVLARGRATSSPTCC